MAAVYVRSGTYAVTLPDGVVRAVLMNDDGVNWYAGVADCEAATPLTLPAASAVDLTFPTQSPAPTSTPTASPTTNPTPTPGPTPTPATRPRQRLAAPKDRIRVGSRVTLRRVTAQGARVTWISGTRKTCSVRKSRLVARKAGVCRLTARAPALADYSAYTHVFRVRVIRAKR